jgi:LytS/YehU family sensor histidine kinase
MYRSKRERTAALEGQLAQARLRMLTMQLHPHFFFNALNSVVALIRKDPDAAERLVVEFSHLVRLALDSTGKSEVTLKDELDFIGLYLAVEQARFQDRLVVRTLIDTETLDAVVPNMILQPLVENAIKYAVTPRREGGRVELRSWSDGRRVYLRVRDDGPGMPKTGPPREGVGLANTRARLAELYGGAARLDLRNAAGGGMAATLMLPLRRAGESLEVDEAGGRDDEDQNAAG